MTEISMRCISCSKENELEAFACASCGDLLEVRYERYPELSATDLDQRLNAFISGVWRYRQVIHPLLEDSQIVSMPEGNTNLYRPQSVAQYAGVKTLMLKHEGENPTGSFKDRGMTAGASQAKRQGAAVVACASTGNTSASMAAYAAMAQMKSIVFIPEGMIAWGKLSQSMGYGAQVVQIGGNFDDAMRLVQEAAQQHGIYLLNSLNPWRIEGQKSIAWELLQQLHWKVPDWIVLPAGNVGNTSALGKALQEARAMGWIETLPRIAAIQAQGAQPFYKMWNAGAPVLEAEKKPETIATAIRIGNPVSWKKALRTIQQTHGVVEQVSDDQIMDAKAVIDLAGVGCEPASAASVAGTKKLVESGVIGTDQSVACILTGHLLKDPDATVKYHLGELENRGIMAKKARPVLQCAPELSELEKVLALP